MKILHKRLLYILSSLVVSAAIIINLVIFLPTNTAPHSLFDWAGEPIIDDTAAKFQISSAVSTSFGTYIPSSLDFVPSVVVTEVIKSGLENVDMQGLSVSPEIAELLAQYHFAIDASTTVEDIYEVYDSDNADPFFITTDLCLHTYHVLYDISLRIMEAEKFFDDFELMLITLKNSQIALNGTVSENVVHDAINKNVAFLSVMLYLLNETNTIPIEVYELTTAELTNINQSVRASSAIFGYEEDYTQYKVRGHYTRTEQLGNYFKAMMYAGRMGFLLQSPTGDPEMGIEHTRMAMLLITNFNDSIGDDTIWDYWNRIYDPTVFYVGASDDLMALEYYKIWMNNSAPEGDALAEELIIQQIISDAKNYRKPQINSMFIFDTEDHEEVTQGFRLMGQRFIPDSYIFQQLVHNKVNGRLMPSGLDVFSVFGSPRAAYYQQTENETYPDYNQQVLKLRQEFNNLTEYDWTQNLYWLWLYSLFPLLEPASEGYPGFMLNDAWTDKALMTALGSWAELRHDTILYAKQSYTYEVITIPQTKNGYVEPYPEVYARLASLVRLMQNGLSSRGLLLEQFFSKLSNLADYLDKLTELSIKELKNEDLNEQDIEFIKNIGDFMANIVDFASLNADPYVSEADERTAIIADVHTDVNTNSVLEVGTGNPFVIYVIVQDQDGNYRLTKGAVFSYYEFTHPMNDRLTDEQWQEMLDTNPPELPSWITESLPMSTISTIVMVRKED